MERYEKFSKRPRNHDMILARLRDGETYVTIAERWAVSPTRVRQIVLAAIRQRRLGRDLGTTDSVARCLDAYIKETRQ